MSLKEVPAAKQVVMRLIYVSCKQGGEKRQCQTQTSLTEVKIGTYFTERLKNKLQVEQKNTSRCITE